MTGGLGCSTYTNWMSCDLKTKNARTVNKKFNLTKPKLVAYDVCLGATLPTYIYMHLMHARVWSINRAGDKNNGRPLYQRSVKRG